MGRRIKFTAISEILTEEAEKKLEGYTEDEDFYDRLGLQKPENKPEVELTDKDYEKVEAPCSIPEDVIGLVIENHSSYGGSTIFIDQDKSVSVKETLKEIEEKLKKPCILQKIIIYLKNKLRSH